MARNNTGTDIYDVPITLSKHPFYGLQLDEQQQAFRDAIWNKDKLIVFCNAKAGTGKTLIATATANLLYEYGRSNGIVYIASPTQEQKQGYLKGTIEEKSEPYFEPFYEALLNIGQLGFYPLQITGKGIYIEHHAQQIPAAIPVRVRLPAGVLIPEGTLSFPPAPLQHGKKVAERLLITIDLLIEPFQFIVVPLQTAAEKGRFPCHLVFSFRCNRPDQSAVLVSILYHSVFRSARVKYSFNAPRHIKKHIEIYFLS